MPSRTCHRCHAALHVEDEGTLVFCSVCGAPQVTLSEELQELAAAQRAEFDAAAHTAATGEGSLMAVPDLLVLWKPMIAICASVAAAVTVLAAVVPAFAFMAWVVPAVVLGIYASRHIESRLTGGVGARVGLVSGIFSSFGICAAVAFRLLALHKSAALTAEINESMVQSKAWIVAHGGVPAPDALYHLPEVRAGAFLVSLSFSAAGLLLLSTVSGAASGFVLSRFRRR